MNIKKKSTEDVMDQECEQGCGRSVKTFMHTCKGSHDMVEVEGCPHCDDHCGFCESDIGGEG